MKRAPHRMKSQPALRSVGILVLIVLDMASKPCALSSQQKSDVLPTKRALVSGSCFSSAFSMSRKRHFASVVMSAFAVDVVDEEVLGVGFDAAADEKIHKKLDADEGVSADDEDERSLLLDFVSMVDDAAIGEMELDELALLPKIMEDFSMISGAQGEQIVHRMLGRMIDEWKDAIVNDDDERARLMQPTTERFNMAMRALANTRDKISAKAIWLMFVEMEGLYQEGLEAVQPDTATFNAVLRALSNSREKDSDRRAWSVFQRMKSLGVFPCESSYGELIAALAKSRQPGAAERAEEQLRRAVELFPPAIDSERNVKGIGVKTFNVVLTAWAKSGQEDGPERAESLLLLMDQINNDSGNDGILKPNIFSFTSLVDAHAQKNDWDSVSCAEQILNRLIDQYLLGEIDFEPDATCWTTVISAWKRLAKKGFKGAAQKADKLLTRMEDLKDAQKTSVEPDAVTYLAVLNAWASTRGTEAAKHATDLLYKMDEMHLAGKEEMKPLHKSFRVVIDQWVKINGKVGMARAASLLNRMEEMHPNSNSMDIKDIYRSMLFGWSKMDNPVKAEAVLRTMVDRDMMPDSFCFDKVIESYTKNEKSGSMKRALDVFSLMEECRKAGDLMPNERVYTSFIRAMTKAQVESLAKKALLVLQRMQDMYKSGNKKIQPTVFTYNAVLNACAECAHLDDANERSKALEVALVTFKELRSGKTRPDHVTFGNLLRCSSLLPEGDKRTCMQKATFQNICKAGLVNSYVIRDLQNVAHESVWRELVGVPEGDIDVYCLPAEWTRKIKRKK